MEGCEAGRWPQVLVVDGDADEVSRLRAALGRGDDQLGLRSVDRLRAALDAVVDGAVACVVTDLRLPDADGIAIVRALRRVRRELAIVVVSSDGSTELAAAAIKAGAADYLRRDARSLARLPGVVREALGRSVLASVAESQPEAYLAGPALDGATDLIAGTPGMRRVLALVERAACSQAPVLIEGESGTGKELVARAVHERGPRRHAPFVAQNCAAVSRALLESELFGHVRGAFTGADRDRRGLFEEAAEGTVFLDEIADAPPALQAKLLRVLQHEEVKAVGADRPRRLRARILAASNRSLEAAVAAGRFRLDLYYRLAVLPIAVPPLRHRTADVPALVTHFLRRCEAREGRATGGVDAAALAALQRYPWPGNVRELENEIHRLVLSVGAGERIGVRHVARRIREAAAPLADEPLDRILRRVERALICQRLERAASKSAAARSLGITREALYAKMRRLGMWNGASDRAAE